MLAARAVRLDPDDPLAGLAMVDAPEPDPPEGWQVVAVRAASLNHHDLWSLRGVGVRPDDLPVTLGMDAAGVSEDGREVVVHAVLSDPGPHGDETLSEDLHSLSERGIDGTFAPLVAVPSRNLVPKPAGLGWEEAACLPTAYLTAYRMLFARAGAVEGDRVLVQGAGGGVATAAIILGAAAGLSVSVTSRSPQKRRRALELGAAEAIAPGERLSERVDAVIETVGAATWASSLRALRPGGTLVVAGATTGADPPAELSRVFWRGLTIAGSTLGTREQLEDLCAFVERTGARPALDSALPLQRAPEALARLAAGEAVGKIALTVEG